MRAVPHQRNPGRAAVAAIIAMAESSEAMAEGQGASGTAFATKHLASEYDVLAPDTSEIRVLAGTPRVSMAHGTLAPGKVSLAIVHRTVEEVWYITEGRGQVWRKQGDYEEVVDVEPGSSLTIPVGVHFQFRATGPEPLCFIMCTIPPWPGADEAVRVPDHWPVAEAGTTGATS